MVSVNGGHTIRTSYSQLRALRRCPQRWYYSHVERLRPKTPTFAMEVGSIGHHLIAAFYRGEKWEDVLEQIRQAESQKSTWDEVEATFDESAQTLETIFPHYIEYAEDHDEEDFGKVLRVEKDFKVRIPGTHTLFRGRWDLVVRDSERAVWLVEHKFVKQMQGYEALEYDEQTHQYLWALSRWVQRKELPWKVVGIYFNLIRHKPTQALPLEWVKRERTYRTVKHLEGIGMQMARIAIYQEGIQRQVDFGGPERFIYRNMFMGCFECPYRTLCLLEQKGESGDLLRQNRYVKGEEDELAARR